ncbi:MAG: hypothetical protein LBM96_00655 [Methanobrevibacter sp.]|jgi:hypothetical protein|nr:hypothetical protein [Candidatus Methanoflexus mossambicus]
MIVKYSHRINTQLNNIEIFNVKITEVLNDFDSLTFTTKTNNLMNGNIVIVNNIPFIILKTKNKNNKLITYECKEYAYRCKDSQPILIKLNNNTDAGAVNRCLNNAFDIVSFSDINNLKFTITGIYNANEILEYCRDNLNYNWRFNYTFDENNQITVALRLTSNEEMNNIKEIYNHNDFQYTLTTESDNIASALYPDLNEVEMIDLWYSLEIPIGTRLFYKSNEDNNEWVDIGEEIVSYIYKPANSFYIYNPNLDEYDFNNYGVNQKNYDNIANNLKFKKINVQQDNIINIFLDLQAEYLNLVDSQVKIDVTLLNTKELNVGDNIQLNFKEPINILTIGADTGSISVKIITKEYELISNDKLKITYTTSNTGLTIGRIMKTLQGTEIFKSSTNNIIKRQ